MTKSAGWSVGQMSTYTKKSEEESIVISLYGSTETTVFMDTVGARAFAEALLRAADNVDKLNAPCSNVGNGVMTVT